MAQAKQTKNKGYRASISIEERNGRYRLTLSRSLSRSLYGADQKRIATGMNISNENFASVEAKATVMHLDILANHFDVSLVKYGLAKEKKLNKNTESKNSQPALTIPELWDEYAQSKKNQITITTREGLFATCANNIARLPTKNINDAILIKSYIVNNFKPTAQVRLMINLNACCKWAVRNKLIDNNPFEEIAKDFRHQSCDRSNIDPFTKQEMDAIIEAFAKHPTRSHYTPFVKFLFWTGCRTGEAVGLKWKHIDENIQYITFTEQTTQVRGRKYEKGTKNKKARKFPIGENLKKVFLSIKPENPKPNDYVFSTKAGTPIDNAKFMGTIWKGGQRGGRNNEQSKGIVTELAEKGIISHYRSQYHTRHTFITLALEKGYTAQQIAEWVGNTPEMIFRHYAASNPHIKAPEF